MNKKPKLLDLFCKAGGASMGYYRAGFEVEGVDIEPQPHYPFKFYQADALEFLLEGYDAYHASPPCQFASQTTVQWRALGRIYENCIPQTRACLLKTGKPYIIENVVRASEHLRNPVLLCGAMFGLRTYRHRLFETSFELPLFLHPGHGVRQGQLRGAADAREAFMLAVIGHSAFSGEGELRKVAMGIDWMDNKEITQAIPPAYTECIGKYLMEAIERSKEECAGPLK